MPPSLREADENLPEPASLPGSYRLTDFGSVLPSEASPNTPLLRPVVVPQIIAWLDPEEGHMPRRPDAAELIGGGNGKTE